jgi:hypothetical protein
MRYDPHLRSTGYCLSTALLLAVAASSASAAPTDPVNPLTKRFLIGKGLDICDQGGFFVGGVPKVPTFGTPRQVIIGDMYVQFEIPNKRRQWPIIFIHGGGLTGSDLDATPHGTEGWFAHAVRNNYATFVVDQAGRGRSGFDTTVINEAKATGNWDLIPTFGEPAPSSIWTSWFGHIIPAGTNIITGTMIRHGDPGDVNTAETDPPSEAHGAYPPKYPIPPVDSSIDANILNRVGAIGPAPNPANNAYLALNAYKWHVPSTEVTLPTSTCATCMPTTLSAADTWTPRALAELVERLGGAILSPHSQSTSMVLQVVRLLKEKGKSNLVKGILIPEGGGTNFAASGTSPQDYDNIPFLLVNGDYRPATTRQVNRAFFAQLSASPIHQYVDLDSPTFGGKYLGTTHMNMLGTNNLDVLDFLLNFAEQNIPNPNVQSSCPSGPPPGKGPNK